MLPGVFYMKMSKERAGSLLFLVTGIFGLVFSMDLSFGTWAQPGPRLFPFCLSILLVVSGCLWFVFGRGEEAGSGWRDMLGKETTALKIIGTTAIFILILEPLGYLVASALYLFILFFWVSNYRALVSLGLAVGAGIVSWYFFGEVLSVWLPVGSLWF